MGRKRNTFSKAIKQLKSTRIDEKLQVLNEIPTNSTSGMYALVPGALTRVEIDKENPVVPDYDTIDWDVDGGDGKDTSGLFDNNGDSKFIAPPGDNSYIQGPMAAMYYTWSYPWTMVGYIRESDRRMINLGRIDGKLGDWDGSSGNAGSGTGTFYSYGQLTAEQALWFRDTKKKDNAGNDPENANYRAFYPGPPSNTPDAFGRYYCTITGTPIAEKDNEKVVAPIDLQPSDILSAILDRLGKGERLSKREREWLKGKLPRIDSIQGNRLSKEAWAMDPDKFREKYGMDPEDVRDYYRRFPYGDPSAESQSQPQSQGQENKFLDILNKGLTGLNNVLSAITDNPVAHILDNILPSKIIADTITDRILGGDNPNSYNGQLMMQLLGSIITGNNAEIKLSDQGRQNMFDSIDASKIADAITFGPPSNADAKNAIKPGQKVEDVLTGGWGDQGGSEFSYDPETGKVTITSNKMLRSMDGDKRGPFGQIIEFEDIPNPTTDQINEIVDQAHLKKIFGLVGNIHPSRLAGYTPAEVAEAMNNRFQDVTKALYNFTVEGTASNAVWLRQQLTKLGASPQTESEKQGAGFGGHVYSQESLPLDKLPQDVQDAIRSKFNQRSSSNSDDINYAQTSQSQSQTKRFASVKSVTKSQGSDDKQYTGGSKDFDERGTDDINYAHKSQSQSQTQKVPTVKSVAALTKPGRVYAGGPGWDPKSGTISSPGGDDINYAHKPPSAKNTGQKLKIDPGNTGYPGPKNPGQKLKIDPGNTGYPGPKNPGQKLKLPPGTIDQIKDPGLANKLKSGNKGIKKSKDGKVYTGGSKDFDERTGKYRSKTGKKSKGGKVYTGGSKRFNERTGKYESTSLRGTRLSESRRSDIMKRLKEPVVLPETKQKSYKVAPGKRLNQKTDFQGMDKLIGDTKLQKTFKKPQDIWSQDWQGYNAKLSQDKKNTVLELIGDGKHAFDHMLRDSRAKNAEEMEKFWGLHPELYSYNFGGKKYKATRKEQVRGDYVVFLVDETGKKSSILQSTLNEKLAEEDEKGMLDEYNKLNPKNEPIPYEKDPLFKKVAKRIKSVTDYPKKPSPKGYPDKAPPKLGPDGFHPEYGKKYKYDKLDPVSAKAMPMQDNPEIDGNIEKARQQPVIEPGKEPKKLPIPKKE